MRTRLLAAWRAGEHALWFDLALVVALSAASIAMSGEPGDAPFPGPPIPDHPFRVPEPDVSMGVRAGNLLITVPLLGRRRWPLLCFAAQFLVMITGDVDGNLATLAALLIGAYAVVIHGRSVPLSMGALLAVCVTTAAVQGDTWPELPGWAGVFVLLMPIGLLGVAVRAARGRARASDQRADALEHAQSAATRLAVADERARIARELHDVVSHHVSVMTIQAGAAGKVLAADPDLARGALAAVEASGRETMAELRHLLGVLAPGPGDDLLHPQPGLDQLEALVESVRQAGQPVELEHTETPVPHSAGLAAYRVVQEALTNALRYAPGARTTVTVGPDQAGSLLVEVVNDEPSRGAAIAPAAGIGSGLLGLSERLRVYGGELQSGRRPGGGFRVRATLPRSGPPTGGAA